MTANIYTTLEGERLDLTGLSAEERAFFDRCYAGLRNGMSWIRISNLVEGKENPLVRATGGLITPAVWEHPLFQAVSDLEDRIGILRSELLPDEGSDPSTDPISGELLTDLA